MTKWKQITKCANVECKCWLYLYKCTVVQTISIKWVNLKSYHFSKKKKCETKASLQHPKAIFTPIRWTVCVNRALWIMENRHIFHWNRFLAEHWTCLSVGFLHTLHLTAHSHPHQFSSTLCFVTLKITESQLIAAEPLCIDQKVMVKWIHRLFAIIGYPFDLYKCWNNHRHSVDSIMWAILISSNFVSRSS